MTRKQDIKAEKDAEGREQKRRGDERFAAEAERLRDPVRPTPATERNFLQRWWDYIKRL